MRTIVSSLSSMILVLALSVAVWRCTSRPPVSSPVADTKPVPPKAAPGKVHPSKWDLWNGGAKLRGANVWQKVIDRSHDGDAFGNGHVGPPYAQEDFDRLAGLGANLVVLSHPGIFTERPPYRLDVKVAENLDRLVAMAAKADLYVVIAFRTGPGRNEAGFDTSEKKRALQTVWTDRKAQDGWVDMWRAAAERYRKQANIVGYDPMVEPNGNAIALNISEAETFYPKHGGSLADWNPLAARIADAIRAVDPETPLVLEAMNWGAATWLGALRVPAQPRIVLAIHHYEPYDYTHQREPKEGLRYPGMLPGHADSGGEKLDRQWLERSLAAAKLVKSGLGLPLFVGEYGVMRWEPGAEQYLEDLVAAFEGMGASHALWLWESSSPKITYDEFNYRMGTEPKNHRTVASQNRLLDTVKKSWKKNEVSHRKASKGN